MATRIESLFESTEPNLLATEFKFAEGPVWHPSDHLYFSDIRESKRCRMDENTSRIELQAEQTSGGNGMTFDLTGRLVVCQPGRRQVITVSDSEDQVLTDRFEGKKLNAPNDIVGHSDGSLYFTNPEGRITGHEAEIGYSGVYRISSSGKTSEVCAGMNLPNGLAFSPDESLLYVSNTRPDPKLNVFDLQPDGTAINKRVFAEMPLVEELEKDGVPDGLKVDSEGRVFCTGPGGIWIWEPDGERVGVLAFPEVTTNIAWGGSDWRTMFVTGHTSIYSLQPTTPGVPLPAFA